MTNSVGAGASIAGEHFIRLDFFASFFYQVAHPDRIVGEKNEELLAVA